MEVRQFKFLRTGLKSNYNKYQWTLGKWHKTECVKLCHGFNCSENIADALRYVQGEILAEVQVRGKYFMDTDKSTWEEMKIIRAWHWQKKDSVALAIFCAELALPIFEKQHPADDRPKKAIEAAKAWLDNPTAEAAWTAAEAAGAAARAVEVAGTAEAAARAVEAAGTAVGSTSKKQIQAWLFKHLDEMEEVRL